MKAEATSFEKLGFTHSVWIHKVEPDQKHAVAELLLKYGPDTWDEAYDLAREDACMMLGGGDGREQAVALITGLRKILGVENCSAGPIIQNPDGSEGIRYSCEWPDDEA